MTEAYRGDDTDTQSDSPSTGRKVSLNDLRSNPSKGLECPECGCRHFQVIRTDQQAGYIQRRRVCRHCGKEIRTREITVE